MGDKTGTESPRRNFLRSMWCTLAAWPFSSCSNSQTLPSGLQITNAPNDAPEFERIYLAPLGLRGLTLKVQIKWFLGDLFKNGEIDQSNGNWILFDVDRPAEKIIDADVLAATQRRLREILSIDREYRDNPPRSFTDKRGVTWTRS